MFADCVVRPGRKNGGATCFVTRKTLQIEAQSSLTERR